MLNIIAKNVKSKLAKKVRGKISCHFIGNTLICDITQKTNVFRYIEEFTHQQIERGLSSTCITEQIMGAYINSIKQQFFK